MAEAPRPAIVYSLEAAARPASLLEEERAKHAERARKFGVEYVDPTVRRELTLEAKKERLRREGFATGIDLFCEARRAAALAACRLPAAAAGLLLLFTLHRCCCLLPSCFSSSSSSSSGGSFAAARAPHARPLRSLKPPTPHPTTHPRPRRAARAGGGAQARGARRQVRHTGGGAAGVCARYG